MPPLRSLLPRHQSQRPRSTDVSAIEGLSRLPADSARRPRTTRRAARCLLRHGQPVASGSRTDGNWTTLEAAPLGNNYPCSETAQVPQDRGRGADLPRALQVACDRRTGPTRSCLPECRTQRPGSATGPARAGLALGQPGRSTPGFPGAPIDRRLVSLLGVLDPPRQYGSRRLPTGACPENPGICERWASPGVTSHGPRATRARPRPPAERAPARHPPARTRAPAPRPY
jgi:hypothetical protein